MPNLSHFLQFISVVVKNWAVYVTGGVVMALVWLVCTLINKPMPRNIEIAIALTFLIIALYQAWEEKNKQYIALKELLESSDISLQMNSFSSGQDADGQPVFFVGGLLYNKGGRPSGLINWNIAIEFPNGDKIMGAMPPAPYKDLTVTLPGSPPHDIVFRANEFWPTVSQNPIIGGGALGGWCWGKFFNLNMSEAYEKKALIIIEYTNIVTGKTHQFKRALGASGIHVPFYEGAPKRAILKTN